MTQQFIGTFSEALELALKLEAYLTGGGEKNGMVQVYSQLAMLASQIQHLTKGKEKWEEVW